MLVEVVVRDLGVIESLAVVFNRGMTALTGETGAGKTLMVEAIGLLLGGRADASLVRPGAAEARVDGRFEIDSATRAALAPQLVEAVTDDLAVHERGHEPPETDPDGGHGHELIVSRVVTSTGRSRGYLNGRPVPLATLKAVGGHLVDLHGQHEHQSLFRSSAQTDALDAFGKIDLGLLRGAKAEVAAIDRDIAALGGDPRTRARELDVLRFQVDELERAAIEDAGEDARLEAEEVLLADATAHREHAQAALELLSGDDGVRDRLGAAFTVLRGRTPLEAIETRLRAVTDEVADCASELRGLVESIHDDPERLDAVRSRRDELRTLQRKYGDSLAAVLEFAAEARRRLDELESHDERLAVLEGLRAKAIERLAVEGEKVACARRASAPTLAAAISSRLPGLAMARARFDVTVAERADPQQATKAAGDDRRGEDPSRGDPPGAVFLLSANPGMPLLALSRVASGGELARTMLAVRLALLEAVSGGSGSAMGPATLIFDEVDAGIGGETALAVGRSLAEVADRRQVLVVTHLAQVAAFANTQVRVAKRIVRGKAVTEVAVVEDDQRETELARMLSGQPESATARQHARELLAEARGAREAPRRGVRKAAAPPRRRAG